MPRCGLFRRFESTLLGFEDLRASAVLAEYRFARNIPSMHVKQLCSCFTPCSIRNFFRPQSVSAAAGTGVFIFSRTGDLSAEHQRQHNEYAYRGEEALSHESGSRVQLGSISRVIL